MIDWNSSTYSATSDASRTAVMRNIRCRKNWKVHLSKRTAVSSTLCVHSPNIGETLSIVSKLISMYFHWNEETPCHQNLMESNQKKTRPAFGWKPTGHISTRHHKYSFNFQTGHRRCLIYDRQKLHLSLLGSPPSPKRMNFLWDSFKCTFWFLKVYFLLNMHQDPDDGGLAEWCSGQSSDNGDQVPPLKAHTIRISEKWKRRKSKKILHELPKLKSEL